VFRGKYKNFCFIFLPLNRVTRLGDFSPIRLLFAGTLKK
jgi:hypothetical protein